MYKLLVDRDNKPYAILKDNIWSIPFDPANTDYAKFKADIISDEATLQDADGNEMTAEQAKQFVQELP